jgi:hypothetical protein
MLHRVKIMPDARPQVISSIPYSDIWCGAPTRAELEELIAKADWRDVVTTIAGVAAIGRQYGIEDDAHARTVESFIADQPLYGQSLILKLRADNSQVLFTDESLLAVLRLAVVSHGSSSLMQRELRDLITRAVLMANELIHDEINPPHRTGSPADLMASEIRSNTSILDNPHVLLARTAAFFEWCKDSGRIRSANELPVESDFHEMTGLTPEEYAAGAYAVLSRAAVIREPINISRSTVVFTIDQWLSQIKQKRVPRQWIDVSSLPIEKRGPIGNQSRRYRSRLAANYGAAPSCAMQSDSSCHPLGLFGMRWAMERTSRFLMVTETLIGRSLVAFIASSLRTTLGSSSMTPTPNAKTLLSHGHSNIGGIDSR